MDSNGIINPLGKQYIGAGLAQTNGGGNADGPNAPGGRGSISIGKRSNKFLRSWWSPVTVLSIVLIPLLCV